MSPLINDNNQDYSMMSSMMNPSPMMNPISLMMNPLRNAQVKYINSSDRISTDIIRLLTPGYNKVSWGKNENYQ